MGSATNAQMLAALGTTELPGEDMHIIASEVAAAWPTMSCSSPTSASAGHGALAATLCGAEQTRGGASTFTKGPPYPLVSATAAEQACRAAPTIPAYAGDRVLCLLSCMQTASGHSGAIAVGSDSPSAVTSDCHRGKPSPKVATAAGGG